MFQFDLIIKHTQATFKQKQKLINDKSNIFFISHNSIHIYLFISVFMKIYCLSTQHVNFNLF